LFIRPANPECDYPRIVALFNMDEPEPYTVDQLKHWLRDEPGRMYRIMVAANEAAGDDVIGYSEVVRQKWDAPGQFAIWIGVYPQWRGQGIGSALYAEAEAFALAQGAANLKTDTRENDAAALRFLTKRGFAIDRHLFESTLDLEGFDEAPFSACIAALEDAGIRFRSLADFDNSPQARRKLYEVNRTTSQQTPGYSSVFMPFEEFEKEVCGSEWFRPAGQLVAVDGEEFIALSAVRLYPESGGSYNLITGVLEPYRGRKIALALKLLAIRYARANGARSMRTHNDSQNAPMLAINRKLGYQPQPGKYFLRKRI
jgi:GNAT superfamily N-acetyltransferase